MGGAITNKQFIQIVQDPANIPSTPLIRIEPYFSGEGTEIHIGLKGYYLSGSGDQQTEEHSGLYFDPQSIQLIKLYDTTTNTNYKAVKYHPSKTDTTELTYYVESSEDLEDKISGFGAVFYQKDNGYIHIKRFGDYMNAD